MRCDILSIYQWRSFYRTNKQTRDKTWHCAANFVSVFFLGFLRFMVNCISSSSLLFVRLASLRGVKRVGGARGAHRERGHWEVNEWKERRIRWRGKKIPCVLLASFWKTCTQTRRKELQKYKISAEGWGKGGVKYDTKMLRYPINPLPVSFAGPRASVRDPWRSSCPMSVRRGAA